MMRLQTVLDSWKTVRQDTAQAVLDFPAAALDETPVAGVVSFRETARHILDAGHALSGMLADGIDNFATPEFRGIVDKYKYKPLEDASPQALAEALKSSLEQRTAELANKDADFYAHEMTRFDRARVTRMEMLQFIKEHELTHRSQLFMFLRMQGIVPSTTRRRIAAQKA
jgi:uncharacterized damage-inducible protein DinB